MFYRQNGDSGEYGQPFGGNLLVEFSAELIFPLPFVEDNRQFRPAFFFDAGNVFNTDCPSFNADLVNGPSGQCFGFDQDDMRYSLGFGMSWLSGFGPLTFSIAKPFQTQDFDQEESFQFELGRTF